MPNLFAIVRRPPKVGLRFRAFGVLILLSCVSVAAEESSAALRIETIAETRLHAAGGDSYAPAQNIHVGEEVFYTLRVTNASTAAIPEAIVVKAMPRNTRYVADSATGPAAAVSYSIDGGATFGALDQLVVTTADGTSRPAKPEDCTHLRWQLRHPLAPGATALLRFRGVFK